MSVALLREPQVGTLRQGLTPATRKDERVYAIAFDMDIEQLGANDADPYNN